MSFNGSGTFNRLYNFEADRDAGIKIRADRMDAELDGIATGLSSALLKDGQQAATANQPMGGFRHTNVDDAAARTDYASAADVQDNALGTAADTGAADAYAIGLSPAITAYAAGQRFSFVAGNTNTGASTLDVNTVDPKNIQKNGAALVAGDITAGDVVLVEYDGTQFQMLSPARTPVLTAGGVATAALADGAVTTAKLADGFIDGLTAVTDPATGDAFSFADASDSNNKKKITLVNLLKIVSALTQDNSPDHAADSVLTYDDSASAAKKVLLSDVRQLTLDTEVDATNGGANDLTEIDFASLPAGLAEIEVYFDGVSVSDVVSIRIQIGDAGGVETTGYVGQSSRHVSGGVQFSVGFTNGFPVLGGNFAANDKFTGIARLRRMNGSHKWVYASQVHEETVGEALLGSGVKTLSAELDFVRVTIDGSDTFDAGNINIAYR